MVVSELHPANISVILVTLRVSKRLKSTFFNALHPENMKLRSVSSPKLRFSLMPAIASSFSISQNHRLIPVGRASANDSSNVTY